MANLTTPTVQNGRAVEVTIGSTRINCLNDVPLYPAATPPSKETLQPQSGDIDIVTHQYGYEDTTITAILSIEQVQAIDAMRGIEQEVTLGTGFTGNGFVYLSAGPTLPSAGEGVSSSTITVQWTTKRTPATE